MPWNVTQGLIDFSEEPTSFNYYLDDGVVTTVAQVGVAAGIIKTAVDVITDCNNTRTTASLLVNTSAGTPPVIDTAQREQYYLVTYQDTDNDNRTFRCTIPGPASIGRISGTDAIDITAVAIAAFITAFESLACSPLGGAVQVTGVTYGGRSS